MGFFFAVAVMDKIGGWDKKKEDENQIGARFGACMWFYSKAVLSPRPDGYEEFHSHTAFCYRGNQQDLGQFFMEITKWLQQFSMELQECEIC